MLFHITEDCISLLLFTLLKFTYTHILQKSHFISESESETLKSSLKLVHIHVGVKYGGSNKSNCIIMKLNAISDNKAIIITVQCFSVS